MHFQIAAIPRACHIIRVNSPKLQKSLRQQGCVPNLCNLPQDICQAVPLNTVP